jgi:hypothetical protein
VSTRCANKRGTGKGGFAVLWRAGRVWLALPDRERSALIARVRSSGPLSFNRERRPEERKPDCAAGGHG